MSTPLATRGFEQFGPAHAATEIPGSSGVTRLADTAAIVRRYRMDGPHVTVVMPISTPGHVGDDLSKRWSATRADLQHLGASGAALDHLDHAMEQLPPCGYDVLLTATDDDVAYCWLSTPASAPLMHVDVQPALVLAFAEVNRRPRVVAATIDRTGADLFFVDHLDIEPGESVEGETDRIHKSAGDGFDQARNQRHSEVLWERNAQLVADGLVALAHAREASCAVLSGDRRAVDLVHGLLDGRNDITPISVRAGGRHEPQTPQRLLAAATAAATDIQTVARRHDLERLREELGQQDRAIDGEVHTLQAIADHRVGTLVIDVDSWTKHAHVDGVISAATRDGAAVVVVSAPDLRDGIAGMLRSPYQTATA